MISMFELRLRMNYIGHVIMVANVRCISVDQRLSETSNNGEEAEPVRRLVDSLHFILVSSL